MNKIIINRDWCKGCYICIHICPQNVFGKDSKVNEKGFQDVVVISPEKCIGCKLCELLCPDLCILIEKRKDTENAREKG